MLGLNGDCQFDELYYDLKKNCFADNTEFLYYKHLCGEYYTASAFALWLGCVVLGNRHIPDALRLNQKTRTCHQKPFNIQSFQKQRALADFTEIWAVLM